MLTHEALARRVLSLSSLSCSTRTRALVPPSLRPMDNCMAADSHMAWAMATHTYVFADLPVADAYSLSSGEASRLGLPKRTDEIDLTYGDVPVAAIAQVIAAARPATGTLFYDLGSGVGRGVIAAALLHQFACCVGIELLHDLHAATEEPARRFAEVVRAVPRPDSSVDTERLSGRVEFVNADLFACNLADDAASRREEAGQNQDQLSTATTPLVFICCVTWSPMLMQRLASKLAEELPEGTLVATVGQRLPEMADLLRGADGKDRGAVRFDEAWRGSEKFEWGSEVLILHQLSRIGVLAARRLRKSAASGPTAAASTKRR